MVGVVALWFPYILLNAIFPGPVPTYLLGVLLALLGIALATLGEVPPSRGYLQWARASRQGIVCCIGQLCLLLLVLALGRGASWDWREALVFAPLSALGQELYFRSALLGVLEGVFLRSAKTAVLLQALLFSIWHLRAFQVTTVPIALAILMAAFIAGCLWGWQVQKDRTVLYVTAQHALFLIVL